MKLYNSKEVVPLESITPDKTLRKEKRAAEDILLDHFYKEIQSNMFAFCSLSVVHDQVASESYNFIDKGNYILYNEYIETITRNLGIKRPPVISTEMIEVLPGTALNHHLALEGFIQSVWEKIMSLFTKAKETLAEFFKKYFTRLGSLKAKLDNILKALKKTNKSLRKLNLDSVPTSLANKFPIEGTITLNTVKGVMSNSKLIGEILKKINDSSKDLAKRDVLDPGFVASIKDLKEYAKIKRENIERNKQNKSIIPLTSKNRAINSANRTLKEEAEDSEKKAEQQENDAVNIGNSPSNANVEFDDKEFDAAKKEFETLLSEISVEMNKLKGKVLPGGLSITSVTVDKEEGIKVESDTNKETPSEIQLADRDELISLVEETIKTLTTVEGLAKNYGDVNDTIMKSVTDVDKIIKDIDTINPANLGKYKAVLTNKVRVRLNLLRQFFTNYNRINKNLLDMVVDTVDGVCDYSVTSLKYFGDA